MRTAHLTLLLGGARSGKSHYAETWAADHGDRVLFVTTAEAHDDEMRERIQAHRASRPPEWNTLEAPRQTAAALGEMLGGAAYDTVVIDCLTLLASNILIGLPEDTPQAVATDAILTETRALLAVMRDHPVRGLLVSNEVGMGIVPPSRLGRLYRDALGRANQEAAHAADEVLLFVAGLPWHLKHDTPDMK